MIHGIDTSFLVAVKIIEHANYAAARALLTRLLNAGDSLALTSQVLPEFLHVVTDARRFAHPFDMVPARRIALQWWEAREVRQVFPDAEATRIFLSLMERYRLGRKRLLDAQLAASYHRAGITSLLAINPGDFRIFGEFTCLVPANETAA